MDPGRREMRRMTGLLDSRCVAALAAVVLVVLEIVRRSKERRTQTVSAAGTGEGSGT